MSFQVPLHFEDLTRSAAGAWQVTVSTQREASSEQLFSMLDNDVHSVLTPNSPPTQQFQTLYTLITRYQNLSAAQRRALADKLLSLTRAADANEPVHLKIILFFAFGLTISACNASPACSFWEKTGQELALEAVYGLIVAAPSPPPFQSTDLDQLSSLLIRIALHVLEQPWTAKQKHIRSLLSRCLSTALFLDERQKIPANTALLHILCRHEHLPVPLADVLFHLLSDNPRLEPFVSEFIREIARLPATRLVQDTAAAKSVGTFLTEFVERYPAVFVSNLALILSMFNVDAYTLRNGIVAVISSLIRHERKPDDPLLDILFHRAHRDIHAFTRSKALQSWIELTEASAVPNRLFPSLTEMATSRLDDRTAAVRKYAAQLLCGLLKHNPFGPVLKCSHFREKLNELQQQFPDDSEAVIEQHENLRAIEKGSEENQTSSTNTVVDEDRSEGSDNAIQSDISDIDTGDNADMAESTQVMNNAENIDVPNEESNGASLSEGEKQVLLKKKFYKTAVEFIRAVEKGLATVFVMLRSKSITDVSEAVTLLVTAVQFQLEAAAGRAVHKILPLTLARESNIREKAIDAYVRLLAPGGIKSVVEKEAAVVVAKGLVAMADGATMGELTYLEELVYALCSSREECRVITPAVIAVLWDLFAGHIPGAIENQRRSAGILIAMVGAKHPNSVLQRLDILLHVGLDSPMYARWACVALCNLPTESDGDGSLVAQLRELCSSSDDLSTVEQALNAIFALSKEPEPIASDIICNLAARIYASPKENSVTDLSRFFLVIGHVAVKQLVRIEQLVTQMRKEISNGAPKDENNEDDEHAALELDYALERAEKELVSPNSLLGGYGSMVRKMTADKDAPSELRASAVLCLAKLMCVDKKFCEDNLQLLFSVLASSAEPLVRANAITALGDLTFRFPNSIEPWTSHIYKSLRDEDEKVRKNTLMVLTHLILNDMIKVKGQIVGMAICILDHNIRIANLARLFFHELSRKSANAIYNILPDTISCMSNMDLASDKLKVVVGFLVSLMDKEKHADGMVEKLCHRFRSSESTREHEDLSYCISQLNISTKGLQKLNENFKSYSAAIVDDRVYEYMSLAFAKGNKTGTTGVNQQIYEELITKVNAVRSAGNETEDIESVCATKRTSLASETMEQKDKSEEQSGNEQSGNEQSGNVQSGNEEQTDIEGQPVVVSRRTTKGGRGRERGKKRGEGRGRGRGKGRGRGRGRGRGIGRAQARISEPKIPQQFSRPTRRSRRTQPILESDVETSESSEENDDEVFSTDEEKDE